jgi:phage terminase large subunit-like protein
MTNPQLLEQFYKSAPLYRELFDKQLEFALSPSRFIAAVCSRRAGKTTVCAVKAMQELLNVPGSIGLYLALTDRSVEDIFMPTIMPLVTRYKIKCKVNRDEIIFDNGSKLLVCGANHIHKIETFRGIKLLFCIIDEAASFSEKILHYLVDEIVGPALSDHQGQLMLIGTPAAHCIGMFYDVTQGTEPIWIVKRWTAFDNPYMRDNFKKDAELFCLRKQCDRAHPKFRREYLGEWCADDESLMIRSFSTELPISHYSQDNWRSVIGIDFGFNDETAFSVLAWARNNPKTYVLECFGITKSSVSQIAQQLQRLKYKYKPVAIVGDPAGSSKIMMLEFKEKYGIFMDSAQKTNKAHYIEILNDALVNKSLVLHPETTLELQKEMRNVVWNEERTREQEGMKCDQLDATLYAYREALGYTEKIPVKIIKTQEDVEREMIATIVAKDIEDKYSRNGDSFYSDLNRFMGQ